MSIVVLVEFSSKPETSDALKQFMADAPLIPHNSPISSMFSPYSKGNQLYQKMR